MQNQSTTAPVSQVNSAIYLMERTASKVAVVSHFFAANGDASLLAKQGAIKILEEIQNTIFEAVGHCEILHDYLNERSKPLNISLHAPESDRQVAV